MVWLWIHLAAWIVLAVVVAVGLLQRSANVKVWAMSARVIYLVSIVTGIVLLLRVWQYNPVGSVIKVLLALGFIAFIEIAFARKQQHKLTSTWLWLVFGCCLVVGIFGLWLAQGRPFVS
ncbi:DUF1516 family protein [Schleiferilactobacillus shenzhenensis]|nr:DUF1516 family protein [Schleiferilactobacillus shenzhenensis]